MIDQFISLLALATIVIASFGLGRPILRGLGFQFDDALETAVWSVAVGLIIAGLVLAVMGMTGVLYIPAIGVLTLAAGFVGVGEIVAAYLRRAEMAHDRRSLKNSTNPPPGITTPAVPGWLVGGLAILAIVVCTGSLLGALAPPTAGDAMCYHLALPKTFLAQGSFCYLPYHDRSTFPLLSEIWFLWAMAIDSPTAATLVHWGLGILFALAAVLLAREFVGRGWAWIAGGLVLLTPGVNNQMAAPLNDVALAAMTTLALTAWYKAAVEDAGRRWFMLAGLAAAAAASIKYIAVLFAAAMAANVIWELGRLTVAQFKNDRRRHFNYQHRHTLLIGVAIVATITISVSAVWYVRAAWHRDGNPVYPFLAELQTDPGAAAGFETLPASKSPLGRSPWSLATVAWHLTMHPENHGGRGHQLSAIWLTALPGLLFVRRLRRLGSLLAIAGVYLIVWFFLRQNERFLYPILPLLAVAVVWVWMEIRRLPRLPRLAVIASQIAILLASAAAAATRHSDCLAVALGLESRQHYLERSEPTYAITQYANAVLQPGDRILSQDYREFYFQTPVVWEQVYRRVTQYAEQPRKPNNVGRFLRYQGFSHLLLAENLSEQGIQYEPTLARLADADPSIKCLMSSRFTDSDGARRYYRLVELPRLKK